ncbi:hypothetical protein V3470_02345 [Flavobacterium oreochromis]|uniref:Uncharacterized protein n=3 Tax=Flavobacterium TaxID=237 RepID=A0A246GCZ2_9FLAO|nr:hypothetical protein [Flavobacterium oreochromis]OWP77375.1 hypothetical protein BWG23_05360 [Flavobacterium oreochromis]OWP79179.1 hypothetical protein BWK62_03425 [Flavobacterium oreochromis]
MNSILIFFISFFTLLFQNTLDLRNQYEYASKSKNNTEKFYELIQKVNGDSPVIIAYKGAAILLKSRFVTNKEERKEQFMLGVKTVEQAVAKDANSVEIRLIRLSIQEHTPKFLKYKSNIEEDKKIILLGFNKQNSGLKEYIQRYVFQSKVFTDFEKSKLN